MFLITQRVVLLPRAEQCQPATVTVSRPDKQQKRTPLGIDSEVSEEGFPQSPWGLHQPTTTHGGVQHHGSLLMKPNQTLVDDKEQPGGARGRLECCGRQEKIAKTSAWLPTLMLVVGPDEHEKRSLSPGNSLPAANSQRITPHGSSMALWMLLAIVLKWNLPPCSWFMVTQSSFHGVRIFTEKIIATSPGSSLFFNCRCRIW